MELPEFHVVGRQIDQTLRGKRIERVVANSSPHKWAWFTGDPATYNDRLGGKTIKRAEGRDSHIEVFVDGSCLSITPPLRYHEDGKVPKKHQLLLEFADGTTVSSAIQMWGSFYLYDEAKEKPKDEGKPSPLTEAFTRTHFKSLIDDEAMKTSVKGLLATKQRIPGVGNGVIQDIMWTARVHPRLPVAELASEEVDALFRAVKEVLRDMTERGGRDTEKDLFGRNGGYRTILSKNTLRGPCPACGGKIERKAYLGGNIYFCESCQRL